MEGHVINIWVQMVYKMGLELEHLFRLAVCRLPDKICQERRKNENKKLLHKRYNSFFCKKTKSLWMLFSSAFINKGYSLVSRNKKNCQKNLLFLTLMIQEQRTYKEMHFKTTVKLKTSLTNLCFILTLKNLLSSISTKNLWNFLHLWNNWKK